MKDGNTTFLYRQIVKVPSERHGEKLVYVKPYPRKQEALSLILLFIDIYLIQYEMFSLIFIDFLLHSIEAE